MLTIKCGGMSYFICIDKSIFPLFLTRQITFSLFFNKSPFTSFLLEKPRFILVYDLITRLTAHRRRDTLISARIPWTDILPNVLLDKPSA